MQDKKYICDGCKNEFDLWLRMVDSMANVISASTTLIALMHKELQLPVTDAQKVDAKHRKGTLITPLVEKSGKINQEYNNKNLMPTKTFYEYGNTFGPFIKTPSRYANDFLDEHYRLTKQAITRRYKPQHRLTTLFSRKFPSQDLGLYSKGLCKLSHVSSEKEINPTNVERFSNFNSITKTGPIEKPYLYHSKL